MRNWHRLECAEPNIIDLNARRLANAQQAVMERLGFDVEGWISQPETKEEQVTKTFQERLATWGTSREAIEGQQALMNLVGMQ